NIVDGKIQAAPLCSKTFSEFNTTSAFLAGMFSIGGNVEKQEKGYLWRFSHQNKDLVEIFRYKAGLSEMVTEESGRFNIISNNPYLIDDMKFWNVKPRENNEKIVPPDYILDNHELNDAW